MVKIHANTMLAATPQRTADIRRVAPAPITAEVMTCVVETGAPKCAAVRRTADEVASAAKPRGGSSWMIRRPSVRMMRHPPAYVPAAIAAAAEKMTHAGTRKL